MIFTHFRQFFVFLFYVVYDLIYRKPKAPFGLWCYSGHLGSGKTLGMVEKLVRLQKKFPKAKVYTNFGYKFETAPVRTYRQLIDLKNGKDGIIFAIDELQNLFNTREHQKFPMELLSVLTQSRKECKFILFTATQHNMAEKNFRQISEYVIECYNFGKRWFFQRAFYPENYKNYDNEIKPRKRAWRYSFVASNKLFTYYNTYRIVDDFINDLNKKEKKTHER
jgi:hypothetical protein